MHLVILLLLLLALLFGPQLWARSVLSRHSKPQDHFPGNGEAFARHLLNRAGLEKVAVEQTALGDHYDPADRCVRLSEANFLASHSPPLRLRPMKWAMRFSTATTTPGWRCVPGW